MFECLNAISTPFLKKRLHGVLSSGIQSMVNDAFLFFNDVFLFLRYLFYLMMMRFILIYLRLYLRLYLFKALFTTPHSHHFQ